MINFSGWNVPSRSLDLWYDPWSWPGSGQVLHSPWGGCPQWTKTCEVNTSRSTQCDPGLAVTPAGCLSCPSACPRPGPSPASPREFTPVLSTCGLQGRESVSPTTSSLSPCGRPATWWPPGPGWTSRGWWVTTTPAWPARPHSTAGDWPHTD